MAEQQSSNFLIILCLVLAALLGSARSEDVAAPTLSAYPASGPIVGSSIPDATAAAVAAPMKAVAAAPAEAPAMAMMAPAEAPMMAEAPAAAPSMATAPAVAPATTNSVTATTGYAQRSGPPANCVNEAMTLTANGAPCHDLITSLRGSLPSSPNPNSDDTAIKAAVASAPTPSSSCCSAVRQFINDGCSCDQQLLNLLPMVNVSPSQIQFAIKATQYSACANSANGGWINNPCDSSSSSGR